MDKSVSLHARFGPSGEVVKASDFIRALNAVKHLIAVADMWVRTLHGIPIVGQFKFCCTGHVRYELLLWENRIFAPPTDWLILIWVQISLKVTLNRMKLNQTPVGQFRFHWPLLLTFMYTRVLSEPLSHSFCTGWVIRCHAICCRLETSR